MSKIDAQCQFPYPCPKPVVSFGREATSFNPNLQPFTPLPNLRSKKFSQVNCSIFFVLFWPSVFRILHLIPTICLIVTIYFGE